MSTKNVSLRMDHEIYEAYEKRAHELGFPTVVDYLRSLMRYDILIARPHRVTGELHKASKAEQARFDLRLIAVYLAGETANGSWMERVIARIVEEMKAERTPEDCELSAKVQRLMKEDEPDQK